MVSLEFGPDTDEDTFGGVMRDGLKGYIVDTYMTPNERNISIGPSGLVTDVTRQGVVMIEWTQADDWESGDLTTIPWEDIVKIVVP